MGTLAKNRLVSIFIFHTERMENLAVGIRLKHWFENGLW